MMRGEGLRPRPSRLRRRPRYRTAPATGAVPSSSSPSPPSAPAKARVRAGWSSSRALPPATRPRRAALPPLRAGLTSRSGSSLPTKKMSSAVVDPELRSCSASEARPSLINVCRDGCTSSQEDSTRTSTTTADQRDRCRSPGRGEHSKWKIPVRHGRCINSRRRVRVRAIPRLRWRLAIEKRQWLLRASGPRACSFALAGVTGRHAAAPRARGGARSQPMPPSIPSEHRPSPRAISLYYFGIFAVLGLLPAVFPSWCWRRRRSAVSRWGDRGGAPRVGLVASPVFGLIADSLGVQVWLLGRPAPAPSSCSRCSRCRRRSACRSASAASSSALAFAFFLSPMFMMADVVAVAASASSGIAYGELGSGARSASR